jgi:hypothetical protein
MSAPFLNPGFQKAQRIQFPAFPLYNLISTTQMHMRSLIVPTLENNKSSVSEGTEVKILKSVDLRIITQASQKLVMLVKSKTPSWSQISHREAWRETDQALRELDRLKDRSLIL